MEELHKCVIGPDHIILPWMVAYGASMDNRCRIGADGLTAHQRQYGRPYRKKLPRFSEKVLCKPLGEPESRLTDKFVEGIFAGLLDHGDEFIILTKDAVIRSRTVRRLPLEEQCDTELLNSVLGCQWAPVPGRGPITVPTVIHADPVVPPEGLPSQP